MFPKATIIFSRQKSDEPPAQWSLLKRLYTDVKYYPNQDSKDYLKRLLTEMEKNPKAKLRLTFYTGQSNISGSAMETSVKEFLNANNWRSIISSGRVETQTAKSVTSAPSGTRQPTTRSASIDRIKPTTSYYFDVFGIGIKPLSEAYDPPTKN
jgi:secreted Zn-dependent insulinase-like peptidase